ncbi:unnamed protein product [Paramecium octaurelia]|uniref:Uncharacterized protein n=1 Tax=Paramecium octaurelia TaxID=43137 RepID=A0A8S1UG08_PAROT|nr:unnamed protein product [Paramecium octaurelia]
MNLSQKLLSGNPDMKGICFYCSFDNRFHRNRWIAISFLKHIDFYLLNFLFISYLFDSMSDIILSSSNKCWLSNRLWDVKTGQQKAKLDGHSSTVNSICYSPDVTTLASGSYDNSIRLLNVQTSKEMLQSNSNFKDLLAQFNIPLQNSSLLANVIPFCTILRICQNHELLRYIFKTFVQIQRKLLIRRLKAKVIWILIKHIRIIILITFVFCFNFLIFISQYRQLHVFKQVNEIYSLINNGSDFSIFKDCIMQ